MHLFFKIPIYLGYAVSIGGLIAHFTGWNFLAIIQLDQGMASGVTGLLLSMFYLYLYKAYEYKPIVKETKQE